MQWLGMGRSAACGMAAGKEEGSTLIELAVCLPVAMMMTFGFIYFSLLVFGMCSNAFAERAALRYACLHSNTSASPTTQTALANIVANYSIPYPSNTTTVFVSYGSGGNTIGQPLELIVIVTYTVSFFGSTSTLLELNWGAVGVVIN